MPFVMIWIATLVKYVVDCILDQEDVSRLLKTEKRDRLAENTFLKAELARLQHNNEVLKFDDVKQARSDYLKFNLSVIRKKSIINGWRSLIIQVVIIIIVIVTVINIIIIIIIRGWVCMKRAVNLSQQL